MISKRSQKLTSLSIYTKKNRKKNRLIIHTWNEYPSLAFMAWASLARSGTCCSRAVSQRLAMCLRFLRANDHTAARRERRGEVREERGRKEVSIRCRTQTKRLIKNNQRVLKHKKRGKKGKKKRKIFATGITITWYVQSHVLIDSRRPPSPPVKVVGGCCACLYTRMNHGLGASGVMLQGVWHYDFP